MSRGSAGAVAISWVTLCVLTGCSGSDDLFDYGSTEERPTPGGGETDPSGLGEGYCAETAVWQAEWAALENDVLAIVNQRRSEGAVCGSETFGAAEPLAMRAALQCAARRHSLDMVERDFFDHENPDGDGPGERLDLAGYSGRGWGENIAAGSSTAEGTMQQWMESPGHCSNIMNPSYDSIGVGYQPGGEYGHVWTQVFGAD